MSLLYEFKCMKFSNRHTELWYYKSGEWLPKRGTVGGIGKTGDSGGSENLQFIPCYTALICELCEQYDLFKIHI